MNILTISSLTRPNMFVIDYFLNKNILIQNYFLINIIDYCNKRITNKKAIIIYKKNTINII